MFKKWNYNTTKEAALECETRKEFQIKYYAAWKYCQKNNLMDIFCSHMKILRKNYSKNECKIEALKYDNRTDFNKKSKNYYMYAVRHGWLDEICSHMKIKIKNWTKEECLEKALKCEYRKEFYKKYKKYYEHSLKNGWLEEFCSHMKIVGSRYKRCIYVWEFEDNSAYIGLTYNINNRIIQHKNSKNSQVFFHLKLYKGVCKQLTDYIDVNFAKKQEEYWINVYKNNNWNVLNKAKSGSLGGNPKWNHDSVIFLSKKYKNRSTFKKRNSGAFKYAKRNNMLDFLFPKINRP